MNKEELRKEIDGSLTTIAEEIIDNSIDVNGNVNISVAEAQLLSIIDVLHYEMSLLKTIRLSNQK